MTPSSSSTTASASGTNWPTSARVAGILLLVVGGLNTVAGIVASTAGAGEIQPLNAIGLLVAGVGTVVIGWLVLRGSLVALYVALGVFQVLLTARLVTAGGNAGVLVLSLVVLGALVAVLWVATIQVRRGRA